MELMNIISTIQDVILECGSTEAPRHQNETIVQLKQRLQYLHQSLVPHGATFPMAGDESKAFDTAELYRVAAMIFLERACRRIPRSDPQIEHLVGTGLKLVERLQGCVAMWPLFIVACEVETDEHRNIALDSFEASAKVRKAGNISCIQELAEAVWKQDDLFTYSGIPADQVQLLRYRSVISASGQLPNFT